MNNKLSQICHNLSEYCGLTENIESVSASAKLAGLDQGITDLSEYLVYRSYLAEPQLFLNDDHTVGFLLEISPLVGIDPGVYKNLQHFFNDELLDNAYVQFLLLADHTVEPILTHWQKARTNPEALLQKITQKRAEFIRQQAVNFGIADGRLARNFRIFISFSGKLNHHEVSSVLKFREQLIHKLTALQLAPQICGVEDLIWLVRSMLQMQLSETKVAPYVEHALLSQQILDPAEVQEINETQIKQLTTGLSSRVFYAKELPFGFSLQQGINLLGDDQRANLSVAARFIISYVIASDTNLAQQQAILNRGKKVIDAAEKWYSRNDRELKREAQEWKQVIEQANGGERLLTEHWQLLVTTTSTTLETVSQSLISLYNSNNFKLKELKHLQLPGLLSMLPLSQVAQWRMLQKFKLTRRALSQEVIERLPIHAEWKGVPSSGVLLQARRGQLFNFDPFYKINSGNYNVCIFAPSGGGKSVFLQELAVSQMAKNTRVFILDIGQSFANLAKLLQGEIIQFGREVPFSLNPFANFKQQLNRYDTQELLKCTKSLLEVMCGIKEDPTGSAALEKALVAALDLSTLDLTSFAQFLEQSEQALLQKYGATLYPYTQAGLYGKYFSDGKAATFRNLITVFEFEEIKNDAKLLAIVLQILLMQITQQFLTGDRQTPFMIIVDEAWMLLDFAAGFFAAFGRTVRKYGGSLVVCVQIFTVLQNTLEHKTILENSTWTILLKQDEKGLGAFRESEAFKDLIPLIKSISLQPNKYAEALLCATGVTVVGRLVLDPYSQALYSTDPVDFNFLRQRLKLDPNLDLAVEALVLNKQQRGRVCGR